MKGPNLKQVDYAPDSLGDVFAGWDAKSNTIKYGTVGNNLYFAVLHEFGHYLNGDHKGRSVFAVLGIDFFPGEIKRVRREERRAWHTACRYCPDELFEAFVFDANRSLKSYGIDPIRIQIFKKWRNK